MYLMSNIYIYVTQQDYYELNDYIEKYRTWFSPYLMFWRERERERGGEREMGISMFLERRYYDDDGNLYFKKGERSRLDFGLCSASFTGENS